MDLGRIGGDLDSSLRGQLACLPSIHEDIAQLITRWGRPGSGRVANDMDARIQNRGLAHTEPDAQNIAQAGISSEAANPQPMGLRGTSAATVSAAKGRRWRGRVGRTGSNPLPR